MFGVGAPIGDLASLQKIDRLKRRGQGKAFIVLLSSLAKLGDYTRVDGRLERFLAKFWPGKLTVILPCANLPHLAQDGFVAFRVPQDRVLREFLQKRAVVSTSVNRSGEQPLQNYEQILQKFGDWFDEDWVPKGVVEAAGTPSTVVKVEAGELFCVREGLLDFAKVQKAWNDCR